MITPKHTKAKTTMMMAAVVIGLSMVFLTLVRVGVALAEEAPNIGGTVPSTLALSLSEPTVFTRSPTGGRGGSVYTSVVRVEVSTTEAPTRLSIADGEALGGRRRGHMVRGSAVLPAALYAKADDGRYRSLDASVDPSLQLWSEPVSAATATIVLRQQTHGSLVALDGYHKLLLVTLTAAGP